MTKTHRSGSRSGRIMRNRKLVAPLVAGLLATTASGVLMWQIRRGILGPSALPEAATADTMSGDISSVPKTPRTVIAAGATPTFGGPLTNPAESTWRLIAWIAEVTVEGETHEALCVGLSLQEPEAANSCFIDETVLASDDYLDPINEMNDSVTAFFGRVSPEVSEVRIKVGGTVHLAEIYEPPDILQLDLNFFVAFAPFHASLELEAIDASGDILEVVPYSPPPLLTVQRIGGPGVVVAYPSEDPPSEALDELMSSNLIDEAGEIISAEGSGQDPDAAIDAQLWILCGNLCRAELDGVRATLEAVPGPDVNFMGWSGACSGTGSCEVVIDSDTLVIARFGSED